jgi:hypothetical protein
MQSMWLGIKDSENIILTYMFDAGMVSWNEFASFVLDMHTKGEKLAHGDSVFDGTCIEEKDEEIHHDNSILLCEYLPQQGLLVTAALDGTIKTWYANTGNAYVKNATRCVCVCSVCMFLCHVMSILVSGWLAGDSCAGWQHPNVECPGYHT